MYYSHIHFVKKGYMLWYMLLWKSILMILCI